MICVTSETNTEIQAGTSLLGVTKKGWVFNLVGAGQKDILTCYAEAPGYGLVYFGASGKILSYNSHIGIDTQTHQKFVKEWKGWSGAPDRRCAEARHNILSCYQPARPGYGCWQKWVNVLLQTERRESQQAYGYLRCDYVTDFNERFHPGCVHRHLPHVLWP